MNDCLIKDEDWCWTDDLSTGVSQIDDDHKMLFQLFHEAYLLSLKNVDTASLHHLVAELVDYTQRHFKREEAVMSASSYPFCENHFAIHKQLLKQVKQHFSLIESREVSAVDFVIFLRSWVIEHIKGSDKRMGNYTAGYEDKIEQALQKAGPLTLQQYGHIYLVDDDQAYVTLMQAMTDAAGLKSTVYTSGEKFLQASITNSDLIVLDLHMPEKDGIEVMRELTENQISPTFILISGFDERVLHSAQQFAETKHLKVAKILNKPIDTDDFINVLTKVYSECKLANLLKEGHETHEVDIIEKPDDTIHIDELKQAIEHGELIIYVQPQVYFENGNLSGVEALVRWQHPIRGLILPGQFIPLAEQHQIMDELTEIVILESIKAYKKFQAADININMSINLSAQNINDLTLPEKLGALLKSHNIAPESFMLELTESEIITDTSSALDIFNRLRMKGFSLSIDDFGTGDSSLKKLYQSPFSELKIEQHFVRRIDKDAEATSIVKICTLLAKEFKMHTVAEGVENQAIWDKLKSLGCDIAQGYFIARPMPPDDLIAWVRNYTK